MASTITLTNPEMDTGIELTFLENALKGPNSWSKIANFEAKIIGETRGFLSHLVRVNLEWTQKSSQLPESVILKLPTSQVKRKEVEVDAEKLTKGQVPGQKAPIIDYFLESAHKLECAFYNFAREAGWNVKLPKSYAGTPSVLILEDLSTGFGVEFEDGLNEAQCFSVAEGLASLHAYCIANSDWKSNSDLTEFGRERVISVRKNKIQQSMEIAEFAKKEWPEYIDAKIDKVFEDNYDVDLDFINHKFGLPPVMVHADLHILNVMFEADNHDSLFAMLDWQAVHMGSLVYDLCELFYESAQEGVRKEKILEHYYKSLKKNLHGVEVPFSFGTLQSAYALEVRHSTRIAVTGMLSVAKAARKLGDNWEAKQKAFLVRAKRMLDDY